MDYNFRLLFITLRWKIDKALFPADHFALGKAEAEQALTVLAGLKADSDRNLVEASTQNQQLTDRPNSARADREKLRAQLSQLTQEKDQATFPTTPADIRVEQLQDELKRCRPSSRLGPALRPAGAAPAAGEPAAGRARCRRARRYANIHP